MNSPHLYLGKTDKERLEGLRDLFQGEQWQALLAELTALQQEWLVALSRAPEFSEMRYYQGGIAVLSLICGGTVELRARQKVEVDKKEPATDYMSHDGMGEVVDAS